MQKLSYDGINRPTKRSFSVDGSTGELAYGAAATLTDDHGTPLCNGQVTALDPNGFTIDCQGAGAYAGKTLRMRGVFTNSDGQQLWGTLDATVTDGST